MFGESLGHIWLAMGIQPMQSGCATIILELIGGLFAISAFRIMQKISPWQCGLLMVRYWSVTAWADSWRRWLRQFVMLPA
jgi:hypothetical protein